MAGCLEIDTRICRASCVIYYSSSTSMGLLAWLARPIIVIAPPRKIITFAIIWIFAHTKDCLYIINTSKPALAMMSTVYAYPLPHTTQSMTSPQKLFVVSVSKTRASYSALKTEFLPRVTSKSSNRPYRSPGHCVVLSVHCFNAESFSHKKRLHSHIHMLTFYRYRRC